MVYLKQIIIGKKERTFQYHFDPWIPKQTQQLFKLLEICSLALKFVVQLTVKMYKIDH